MFRKELLPFILCLLPLFSLGQNQSFPDDETHLHLKNEAVGGLVAHQNGWGAFFRRGTHLTGYKKRMYDVEIVSMKNPKEFSVVNPSYENASSFVFGKLHSLLIVRTGMGIQKVIFSKAERAGVEIKYSFYGGVSWGIAKPVYLDILHATEQPYQYEVMAERYDPVKHSDIDSIYGRSTFGYGLDELKVYPGLYSRFGLNFEYGSDDETVKALEAGVIVDAYPKSIPMMSEIKNDNLYLSFYISFMYGGRWK